MIDLSFIEHFIPNLAKATGLDPATVLMLLVGISSVCNVVGRQIPDDVVGWKGTVRNVCKFLGMYSSNRVSAGVKTSDVIKATVGLDVPKVVEERIRDLANDPSALIPDVIDSQAEAPLPVSDNPFGRFAEQYVPEEADGEETFDDDGRDSSESDDDGLHPGRS